MEISTRFAECERDPSHRSIAAVLRITHEQMDARGHLQSYPKIAMAVAAVAVLLGVASFLPGSPFFGRWNGTSMAFGCVALAVGVGAFNARELRRACSYQERQISILASASLVRMLDHGVELKPLRREYVAVLKDLVRRHPSPQLQRLFEYASTTPED